MKQYILFFLFAFSTVFSNAQNSETSLIIGKWYNYDKTEIIEIKQLNNFFIGHIVWMKEPNDNNGAQKFDKKNPDIKSRNQTILGSQNIFGLQYESGKWKNGKIYSYKKGGTVKFNVISISGAELIIELSIGFFTKKLTYTKVK